MHLQKLYRACRSHGRKDFTGPEGQARHFGCSLSKVNCPVPDWAGATQSSPECFADWDRVVWIGQARGAFGWMERLGPSGE